jgi:tetratricopeptide (TPR) repeat protein
VHQSGSVQEGSGNTIVQICGDGNTVVTGLPHLVLTRYFGRRQIRQELDRLSPYTRSVRLMGRAEEMASLETFLRDNHPILVRVLTGSGGSGKTRVAVELCEKAASEGWNAGFVTRKELRRFHGVQNLREWGWQKPTLIVIDYAAEHAEILREWLDELADRTRPPNHSLRLLLLERDASTETGWWTEIFNSGGYGASSKRALLDPPEPLRLQPVAKAEDRLKLLQATLEAARPGIPVDLAFDDTGVRERVMNEDWRGDPLYLMMAALQIVQGGHARALALGRTDLADGLAQREIGRLHELGRSRSLDPVLVQHLAACVTLAQGADREEFEDFCDQEMVAIHRPHAGGAAQVADLLQEALPQQDRISPVLPDLIGEALVLRALGSNASASAVLRCHKRFGRPVFESVIRCAQDYGEHNPTPLHWIAEIAKSRWNEIDHLAALDSSLPTDSVVLADLSLRVAQRLKELRAADAGSSAQDRAASLNGLAIAYRKVGQREAALQAAQEAVDLYRELATQQPDAFRPYLAMSLNNLANMLSDLGQCEAALRVAQESVDIRRELAAHRADAVRPDLAISLNNLAKMLSGLGQRATALQAAQEAANLYRELAADRPDAFRPYLAISLNNLANMLRDLGQREAALQAAQEAADLHREFAAQRPDAFRPDLAMSLNNLAQMLSDLGQRERALQAAQEAVDLYREFAAKRPDAFRPDLAISLNNLANRLSDLGQREPALRVAQESVDLYRELAARRRDAFRPDLAMSLNNLANRLSDLGQREAALQAAQESVDIRRELAADRPDAVRPDLAMSLNNLANMLSDLGQWEAALQAAQAAAELYREFAADWPDAFRPDLAMSLNNLAIRLGDLGQREAALQAAQEAVDLYRELAAQRPDAFRSYLATSLTVLALRTSELDNAQRALPYAHEAVSTLTPEFLLRPSAHASLLRAMLRGYLSLCETAEQAPDRALLDPILPYFAHEE